MPEKVPEKTPGAWLTKLSIMAPGLREEEEEERAEALVLLLGLLALQFASGQGTAVGVLWGTEPGVGLGRPGKGWWERLNILPGSWEGRGAGGVLQ